MAAPVKPAQPSPLASRNAPSAFPALADATMQFAIIDGPNYVEAAATYTETQAAAALASAIAGNLSGLDLLALAGDVIGVNAAGDALEGVALEVISPASQPEAEAGAENTKYLTSLRGKQAIDAQVPTLFTKSHAVSGYTVMPDGTIIQWAKISANTWTFPIAFPTACIFGTGSSDRVASTASGADYVSAMTATSLYFVPGSFPAWVMAIGY